MGYEPSDRTKSDLYREVLPAVKAGRVGLLELPPLPTQLAGFERKVSRGGVTQSTTPPEGTTTWRTQRPARS